MFAIALTYSVVFPPMLPLGFLYAACKVFGDRYALLFAHEGNLDAHFCSSEDGAPQGDAGTSGATLSFRKKVTATTARLVCKPLRNVSQ